MGKTARRTVLLAISTLSMLLASPAGATMVGPPIARPDQGRFILAMLLDTESQVLVAQDCIPDPDATTDIESGCEAIRMPNTMGFRLDANLFDGIGLFGDLAVANETIFEAAYMARGYVGVIGLRLSTPIYKRLYIGLTGSFEKGSANYQPSEEEITWDTTTEEDSTTTQEELAPLNVNEGYWTRARLSAQFVLMSKDETAFMYSGLYYTPYYTHHAEVMADPTTSTEVIVFDFEAKKHIGLSYGAELRSDNIAVPWSGRHNYIFAGVEFRFVDSFGASTRIGVSF